MFPGQAAAHAAAAASWLALTTMLLAGFLLPYHLGVYQVCGLSSGIRTYYLLSVIVQHQQGMGLLLAVGCCSLAEALSCKLQWLFVNL